MNTGFLVLAVLAVTLFAIIMWRDPGALRPAFATAREQILTILLRMPFALIAAAHLGLIIPRDAVASWLGPEGGLLGILVAWAVGAIIPGGPVMMFPLALVLWRAGAGEAQMVALLTSWTTIALHRSLTFEMPLVGPKFATFRIAVSWILPLIAGILAIGLTQIIDV